MNLVIFDNEFGKNRDQAARLGEEFLFGLGPWATSVVGRLDLVFFWGGGGLSHCHVPLM